MWLFKSQTPKHSQISTGIDRQTKCKGCSHVEILLDRAQHATQPPSGRLMFHADFAELEACAKRCATCRIFRQALILPCATTPEAEQLATRTRASPVYAAVKRPASSDPTRARLALSIEIRGHPGRSALIWCCASDGPVEGLNLCQSPRADRITGQIQQWLGDCGRNHKAVCSGLRWSSDNPSRLVRILSGSELQLCDGIRLGRSVQYAALSYSWGTQILTKEESPLIERGKTTYQNLLSRYRSFPPEDLPCTLADAISLCRRVGLSYVWIDSLCIIQDNGNRSDFMREASRMHEYYGNAHFTLSVCSNLKATAPLLARRTAFSYATSPCRLGSLWLFTPNVSLTDMISHSPLSKRAWTLQEERLSPRILYWTPNRMYWSCAQAQCIESQSHPLPPLPLFVQEARLSYASLPENEQQQVSLTPQAFLLACNRGTAEERHRTWLSIIESYALRDMSNPQDRFPALAGLASKYHQASSCPTGSAYIAGLWQATFAMDLAWGVNCGAILIGPPNSCVAGTLPPPSWTWASLPPRSSIYYADRNLKAADVAGHFELLEIGAPQDFKGHADLNIIHYGSLIPRVRVRARLRRFWRDEAIYRPWFLVICQAGQQHEDRSRTMSRRGQSQQEPVYSFASTPEQSAFSADVASGRVVSYEARKQEIVGQLDYRAYAAHIIYRSAQIFAMELTKKAMLLLKTADGETYSRVGVATKYRPDFFDSVDDAEAVLI